ncbi:RICIN domain-containing protein [Kitasatospora sp. NPDC088548]|uniref:RICIN domain-containing protein n=1 Tax=Kitasatospora sp. NPDC088548 TaxID=3364075 RepID=UPI0037FD6968
MPAALGTGLALTVGVPSADADDYHPSRVPNVVTLGSAISLHCLEIGGWSTGNGAPAQQWSCTGGANQKWLWIHVPGGDYTLRNAWSGKCLDVPAGANTNGVRIQQWDCWNGNNQIWYTYAAGQGYPPVNYWGPRWVVIKGQSGLGL